MSDKTKDGRASAEIVIVKRGFARAGGRPAPVMTVRLTKEAGVSFSDGGRLAYWLVRRIEEGIHEVDPELVCEWVSEGFGADAELPVLLAHKAIEPFEGTLEVVYDGDIDKDSKPTVVVRSGSSHRIGRAGDVVTIWREKEVTL